MSHSHCCSTPEDKYKVVQELYRGFFNGHDINVAKHIIVPNYKQHNPDVPNGIEPFLEFFTQTFQDNPEYSAKIYRHAVNCDLVWIHVNYQNNPNDLGEATVDIYRVNDDGKITEHWDVNQPVPATTASGNSMFD